MLMAPCENLRTGLIGLLCALCVSAGAVLAQDDADQSGAGKPGAPVFAVDSIAHAGQATRILASPDERHFVTVATDKTIRIWDVDSGRLLRRWVVPVEGAVDGELMALALSPDGQYAAVGGYLRAFGAGKALLIVSLRDGSIRHSISGFASTIGALDWSADGRYLAVGLGDDRAPGIRIFETATWTQVFADTRPSGRVSALGFRADNALFATTHNFPGAGAIYLYRPQGLTFSAVAMRDFGNKGGYRAYWSHDGKAIYVAGHGYFDGEDLREPPHPTRAHGRRDRSVLYMGMRESPEGRRLFGFGFSRHEAQAKVRRWSLPHASSFDEMVLPDPQPTDFVVLKSGLVGYVTSAGVVAAIGPDFKLKWRHERKVAAVALHPERLQVSSDESTVSIPVERGDRAENLAFNLLDPGFVPADSLKIEWKEPLTSRSGMRVLSWQGTQEPSINEVRFPMKKERERSLSVAVHSTENALVFGSNGFRLRKVNAEGGLVWEKYLRAEVSAVNLLEARGMVLAATLDGFLHLVRWSDGELLLSVYLEPGARRWIAVAPDGGYEAGMGAEDLAGWIVSAGPGRVADFFPLSRFRSRHLRPGLVKSTVAGAVPALASAAPAAVLVPVEAVPVLPVITAERLPPVVDILSPGFEAAVSAPQLTIRYRVRSADDAPVLNVTSRVLSASQASRGLQPKSTAGDVREITVDLPPEDAEIQILAENRWGISVPARIKVHWAAPVTRARAMRGVLHVVSVGISQYDNPDYRLGFAAKDAQDFVRLIRQQEGGLYSSVRYHLLTDQMAAKGAIEQAFNGLHGQVGPLDTTMIFLAGHGINDVKGEYRYLPREASLDRLMESGVSFRTLGEQLARLPGRTVMFVDTCFSGNVVGKLRPGQSQNQAAAINALASAENNIIVFASSTGAQVSLEDARWGNGAFTKALLEGFAGRADLLGRGRVTYKQLDAYVADRVDELTEGRQNPVTPVLHGVPDFVLTEVRR